MQGEFYRSRENKMLGGVCAGLSDYLGVSATLVRLFFVVAAMASGLGAIFYLILWLITPPEGAEEGITRNEAMRIGADEIKAQASELSQELQAVLQSDNPRTRMIVRWSLAFLIGMAMKRMRPRRRYVHHAGPHKHEGTEHGAEEAVGEGNECCGPGEE